MSIIRTDKNNYGISIQWNTVQEYTSTNHYQCNNMDEHQKHYPERRQVQYTVIDPIYRLFTSRESTLIEVIMVTSRGVCSVYKGHEEAFWVEEVFEFPL